jgi:hypothetical protein
VNLWRRARRKNELPSAELIAEMRARVGFRNLRLDPARRTAELLVPEMRLDVGSIGKAYAVDAALAVLKERGFPRALVGGSGDMAAGDPPPGQPGWRIEVAPLDAPARRRRRSCFSRTERWPRAATYFSAWNQRESATRTSSIRTPASASPITRWSPSSRRTASRRTASRPP